MIARCPQFLHFALEAAHNDGQWPHDRAGPPTAGSECYSESVCGIYFAHSLIPSMFSATNGRFHSFYNGFFFLAEGEIYVAKQVRVLRLGTGERGSVSSEGGGAVSGAWDAWKG